MVSFLLSLPPEQIDILRCFVRMTLEECKESIPLRSRLIGTSTSINSIHLQHATRRQVIITKGTIWKIPVVNAAETEQQQILHKRVMPWHEFRICITLAFSDYLTPRCIPTSVGGSGLCSTTLLSLLWVCFIHYTTVLPLLVPPSQRGWLILTCNLKPIWSSPKVPGWLWLRDTFGENMKQVLENKANRKADSSFLQQSSRV